jgi:hypothetical protein
MSTTGDLETYVRRFRTAFPVHAEALQLALGYLQADPASSLTKSRIVLEKLLVDLYTAEQGREPRKPLIGEILSDNQFTRKIDRRIVARMNAIRDLTNLGPHGEPVEPSDAVKALDDLCEVLEWYRRRGISTSADARYEYLLPVFVGHAPNAGEAGVLRSAVTLACQRVSQEQRDSDRGYLCVPRFMSDFDHEHPATTLDAVRRLIRESALSLFDVSQPAGLNTFLELGVAIGIGRPVSLVARQPYASQSDLLGYKPYEYAMEEDLGDRLATVIRLRIGELLKPPLPDQHVIYQKMQIDAIWQHRLEWAEDAVYFFARDLSWTGTLRETLRRKVAEGVTIRICCERPGPNDTSKWENISKLHEAGAEIRLYDRAFDPGLRGFIWEPLRPARSEAVFVHKQARTIGSHELRGKGWTIGESEYLYTANIYNGRSYSQFVTAAVRLFESMWEGPRTEAFQK